VLWLQLPREKATHPPRALGSEERGIRKLQSMLHMDMRYY
jgi:hypothetical protein